MVESKQIVIDAEGPIVMVDDSDIDRQIAESCLRKSSLEREFTGFDSGRAFFAYLEEVEAGRRELPALVLLDINMPEEDGFQVLRRLRAMPRYETVPVVVMLSHSDDPFDVEASRAHGASGFTTKPFEVADYVAFFDSFQVAG